MRAMLHPEPSEQTGCTFPKPPESAKASPPRAAAYRLYNSKQSYAQVGGNIWLCREYQPGRPGEYDDFGHVWREPQSAKLAWFAAENAHAAAMHYENMAAKREGRDPRPVTPLPSTGARGPGDDSGSSPTTANVDHDTWRADRVFRVQIRFRAGVARPSIMRDNHIYPCLIRSMQKLTARGIRLAGILRADGVPVIESYPGAAQDIMRIPRKGAGSEWLKMGLMDFGVSGDHETQNVTHDELDAVTSALVGTFHLAGMTEALGTEEEPPLIIPRLRKGRELIAIGVSGPIAAGKTTLAHALERRGFSYTRFSLALDDLLAEKGFPRDRFNRQKLGNEINASGRQRWLSARTVARVADADRIVIDGLRFPDDHAFMVERFGARFRHVFVDAGMDVRCSRYEDGDSDVSFDDASGALVERRVGELRSLAHEVFVNQGDKSALDRWADRLASRVCTR